MTVENNKVITINYTLTNDQGEIIDESNDGSFCYIHGADNIIPGLEKELHGKAKGDKLKLVIQPEDAYGEYNAAITQVVERAMFGDEEVEVGMQFHAEADEGGMVMITISEINGDQITIDGNHPLAGVTLHYDVDVHDIRDATEEELSHGHVHVHGHSCSH
ncbi:MAG: peptidylprolyl isomerase [Gammaproteobacteria bacterium]|nr:peptidylprolyl isomerase [Gammaproteobacteria bacterium]